TSIDLTGNDRRRGRHAVGARCARYRLSGHVARRRLIRLALGYPATNLSLGASDPLDGISWCATSDLVAQLRDVGDLGVQTADRIVEDREREPLIGIVDDADLAGPLPRPQRLVEARAGRLQMPVQVVDDVFGILTASKPRTQDDGVLDDNLILPTEVLHPAAQRLTARTRGLIQRDGAFPGLCTDLGDHPARQQPVQFPPHVADRRRPVEVPDGQLGAGFDLACGELLVVGRQHAQYQVSGYRQAIAGASRTHDDAPVKYGRVRSGPTS